MLRERRTLQSLVAVSTVSACVVAPRLGGIALDGVDARNPGELQDESPGLVLALSSLACYAVAIRARRRAER